MFNHRKKDKVQSNTINRTNLYLLISLIGVRGGARG